MLNQEVYNNKKCLNGKSTKTVAKITINNQYVICKKCSRVKSIVQWFQ